MGLIHERVPIAWSKKPGLFLDPGHGVSRISCQLAASRVFSVMRSSRSRSATAFSWALTDSSGANLCFAKAQDHLLESLRFTFLENHQVGIGFFHRSDSSKNLRRHIAPDTQSR